MFLFCSTRRSSAMSVARTFPASRPCLPVVPFGSAEEAWFWFVRCQRLRRAGARPLKDDATIQRPCDPDDIYRAAERLFRIGRIGVEHLRVLVRFGLRESPPDSRRFDEERAARFWSDGLDRLATLLKAKGIVQ
jgi:hypothetical protein